MMSDMHDLLDTYRKSEKDIQIVRVSTSYWRSKRGIHSRKDVTYLKRLSRGFNILDEDASNAGADKTYPRITNIESVDDGVYEVVTCNEYRDWETGYIEDYDFELIPYKNGEE